MAAQILITGATGRVGKELVDRLSRMNVEVRAAIHTPEKMGDHFSAVDIENIAFDFNDPVQINNALEGIEKVFLCTPIAPSQVDYVHRFVDIAKNRSVKHIVRLSMFGVDSAPPIQFTRLHKEAEQIIIDSGIPYTIIRPNFQMQNFISFVQSGTGMIYLPVGNGRISCIDVRDIAAAVIEILLSSSTYFGKTIQLTGPQSLSMYDVADSISSVIGERITYNDISEETAAHALESASMSPWMISGMLEMYAMHRNSLASKVIHTFEEVAAFTPVTFLDFVRDYAEEFKRSVSV